MKILIVQTSFLGDTILSTPVIEGIKSLHPDAELWMMTTPLSSHLVAHDPLLSGVIPYDKRGSAKGLKGLRAMAAQVRAMGFHRVYSLHRSIRTSVMLALAGIPERIGFSNAKGRFLYHRTFRRDPSVHDVLRNLAILEGETDITTLKADMRLFPPPDGDISENLKQAMPPGPFALMVPGSAWETKMWYSEGYRSVAKALINKGLFVVVAGGPAEAEACSQASRGIPAINLAGKTGIGEMIWVASRANVIICNDSMALHMASALKVPNVAIFCSTTPAFGFGPWKNNAIVVEKELPCRPCGRHGKRECPNGTEACMREITPQQVLSAVETLLAEEHS
ncbi:glycosyltransferase family 9 protein [Desulfoluna butyratoxydans]|uniref:Glycosyl transferase family 9 n=1 Tax=Desulfoluna butyratoxydans TaxID=231438 RepID=A0A4U8YH96_9BACT|nr:glycosyltransferase family 9 protein [Desulfoluna butyratoxydans]VFQ42600.1 glycosyl transferase family 9 [Desulfoluna butyratoxydans]